MYQLMKNDMLAMDPNIIDFSTSNWQPTDQSWRASSISAQHVQKICDAFNALDNSVQDLDGPCPDLRANYIVYESILLPGQLQFNDPVCQ